MPGTVDEQLYLYHTNVTASVGLGRWLLSTLGPDSALASRGAPGPWVLAWIDSWSLSPLLIAGDRDEEDVAWLPGERETIGAQQRPAEAHVKLDLLCHSMPLTVHVSSAIRPELSGFYLPTGTIRDGTQVLERGAGTGVPGTSFGPLFLTYHHTPPARARWLIGDDVNAELDALAFHDVEEDIIYAPDENRSLHLIEQRLKEWKGDTIGARPHPEGVWVVQTPEGWKEDVTFKVRHVFQQAPGSSEAEVGHATSPRPSQTLLTKTCNSADRTCSRA